MLVDLVGDVVYPSISVLLLFVNLSIYLFFALRKKVIQEKLAKYKSKKTKYKNR